MKVKKLVRKMHLAILEHNLKKEKKLWFKALKKSLQHKHTEVIK
jgi:hypothetical protein